LHVLAKTALDPRHESCSVTFPLLAGRFQVIVDPAPDFDGLEAGEVLEPPTEFTALLVIQISYNYSDFKISDTCALLNIEYVSMLFEAVPGHSD
jgi:hypothetical protein